METDTAYRVGARDERPWGCWEVLAVGAGFAVKRIEVSPGHRLSLQLHHHRAEHWVILAGEAEVTLGDALFRKGRRDTVFVPVGVTHRIANTGAEPLVFIEVQSGDRLRESDIVRLEDSYGRR